MFGLFFSGHSDRQLKTPPDTDTNEDRPHSSKEEGSGDEVNAALLSLLPWGVSILFHVGLVLIAVFVIWSTIKPLNKEDEVIIPMVRWSETPRPPLTVTEPEESIRSTRTPPTRITQPTPTDIISIGEPDLSLIGTEGISPISIGPIGGMIPGRNEDNVEVFGGGGNAERIAYIIDASGSLLDSLPFAINEIKKSISKLTDKQSFTVIFFQEDGVIESPPKGLKKARSGVKRQVIDWIDLDSGNVTPKGRSNPVKAMKQALRYKPELVILLSDNITGQGQYEMNQSRLLAEIKKANTARTKINTIQFLYPDPLSKVGLQPTMELISESTGGIYKFVDGRELGIQW